MLTTLYCDASFCPHQLVGGWAIWIRSERGRFVENGKTPDYCQNSSEAELVAIYAGIYRTLTRWPETTAILVRSDCTAALDWMVGRHHPKKESGQRVANKIQQLKHQRGVRLIPRWVKAHREGSETDVYLNRRVDKLAREMMVGQRKGQNLPASQIVEMIVYV